MNYTKKCKHKKQIPGIGVIKGSYFNNMLIIPSIDLVGVDVAVTIEDDDFDKDLENKSSLRYKKLEKQVKQRVSKWE